MALPVVNPTAGVLDIQVVPLLVNTLPDVLGAVEITVPDVVGNVNVTEPATAGAAIVTVPEVSPAITMLLIYYSK